MGVKHANTATHDDGPSDGRVQPSWWNQDHDIGPMLSALFALAVTPGTATYIKDDGTAGTFAISAFARSILNAVDAAAFGLAIGTATLDSPHFTGVPLAPTPALNTNTAQVATMAALQAMRADLVASSPSTLDTLKELADALGDDPNFATTTATSLGNRLRFDAAQTLTAPQKAQALTNLGVVLATVASTGAYADLTGKPTLGTAAALNVGAGANNIVQLDGSSKLPAVDGSKLTGVISAIPGYLSGLQLSTAGASATFGVSAGVACDSTGAVMMKLASALSKTTAAWAVGNAGALDTGAIANNTWYRAFEIERLDTGVVDACVSVSAAPTFGGNIPAAYTVYRFLGWMKTNGSGQWQKFVQDGDFFALDVPTLDATLAAPGTSPITQALATPPARVRAFVSVALFESTANGPGSVTLSDLSLADPGVAGGVANTFTFYVSGSGTVNYQGGTVLEVMTNATSQIRVKAQQSTATMTLKIGTVGWLDLARHP